MSPMTPIDPDGGTHQEQPTLADLESVIARGLPEQDEVALALLDIHDRKLFRPAYRSFKDYLLGRWRLSRARGYQLLHFARLKRMSAKLDTNAPENERQARARNAQGQARQREDDPVMRAMNYVANAFDRLPALRQREFIDSLRGLLAEMEQMLNQAERAVAPGADFQNEPNFPAGTAFGSGPDPCVNQ